MFSSMLRRCVEQAWSSCVFHTVPQLPKVCIANGWDTQLATADMMATVLVRSTPATCNVMICTADTTVKQY